MERHYNLDINVLEAAKERISYVFDNFENVNVSISGGKDSTVLCHLVLQEAVRRNRKVGIFYLDEEVVYQATIEQVEYLMSLYPQNTIRYWLQIPFNLTNSTSMIDSQVKCWDPLMEDKWMHKRSDKNILEPFWSHKTKISNKTKGFGFYDVLYNFELSFENTAFFIGLRADESYDRYRAMIQHPGFKNVYWSTKRKNNNISFYPIFDWTVKDVWHYILENDLKYHKYYDFAFLQGKSIYDMRVSSLTHEKSYKIIQDLPSFEFETYEKLLDRIGGIAFAQETAKNDKMFKCKKLPKNFTCWKDYRDFLLETYPIEAHKEIFKKRFSKYLDNEYVCKQECKQLILSDYENNFPIENLEKKSYQSTLDRWKNNLI